MTELEKAAREALETLEALKKHGDIAVVVAPEREYRLPEVIVALRTTIEQAETAQGQEPVGWAWRAFDPDDGHFGRWGTWHISDYKPPRQQSRWFQVVPLPDTTPPIVATPLAAQRQWVGISEGEIDKLKHLIDWTATWSHGRFAYEIEQLLKEKNA
ncbi:MAG: hypothetical protein ACK5U7_12000 [Bacteroidota bacterium]|jgi:hypothetical protein